MTARLTGFLFALLLVWSLPGRAVDESDLLPVEQAFALTAAAPTRAAVELRFAIAPGYYMYRHRFGVAAVGGEPKLVPFSIPDGEKKVDEFFGAVETYRGSLLLTQALPELPASAGAIELEVRYQGCADIGICYPPQKTRISVALPEGGAAPVTATGAFGPGVSQPGTLSLGLPAGGLSSGGAQGALPEDEAFRFEAIATGADSVLARFTIAPGYYLYRDKTKLRTAASGVRLLTPRWPPAQAHTDAHFGDVQVYFESFELPVPVARESTAAQSIAIDAEYQGCKTNDICYPVMRRTLQVDLPAGQGADDEGMKATGNAGMDGGAGDAGAAASAPLGLFAALGLALLGGLILNLMPCVLPILSLKALALAESGHDAAYARRHALWYTLGVLGSFAAIGLALLALRSGGSALGWGFQLQQPAFVGLLVYVMLAIGLSMSGVIAFGASWGGLGQSLTEDEGSKGAFFTGVLACVVASPCTAPFMGGALAYAVAQPAPAAFAIFLALGLGLALPFLVIGFVPALVRLLPRPGAWMETLKQALAYPMYLTGIWLLWVLGHQVGIDGAAAVLAGGVALAMALWWFERHRPDTRLRRWALALPLLLLAAWPLRFVAGLDAPAKSLAAIADVGEVWSEARLNEVLASGRPAFVNMTADWCVTCKVNERAVLSQAAFRTALEAADAAYLKGDWTNEDPAISAFLKQHGAVGVPLYVVYPKNGGAPRVLPALLTAGTVEEALAWAAQP
ncbi:MAG: thioredoxin family protein [Xanthomonadales bacterium]|nr:Thiol:disulfide interchange protein DsbD [Xanthomonadales bacterium]MCC6594433.1 thioredoxin family protein [Xanthomonadales bacterium]MCE7931100.1 cytochrome C biogenesis protein [Xanthomonadales bacterium PRO6]